MAIFKKVAKAGKYQDDYAIQNLITYITRPDKTPSQMIGGCGVDPDHIADSMVQISNQFNKNSRIRLHHFIVSFCKWECSAPGVLYCIGMAISNQIGPEYQIAFALHEDFSCADLLYCRKIQYNEKNDNVGGKCHDLSGIDGLLGPGRIQLQPGCL